MATPKGPSQQLLKSGLVSANCASVNPSAAPWAVSVSATCACVAPSAPRATSTAPRARLVGHVLLRSNVEGGRLTTRRRRKRLSGAIHRPPFVHWVPIKRPGTSQRSWGSAEIDGNFSGLTDRLRAIDPFVEKTKASPERAFVPLSRDDGASQAHAGDLISKFARNANLGRLE